MNARNDHSGMRVSLAGLQHWLSELFKGLGLPAQASADVARNITEAERRGVRSHGLVLVPVYAERIRLGGINPHVQPILMLDAGALVLMDGRGGVGQSVAFLGARLAVQKAREFGVGLVNIQNNNHIGHLASYGIELAESGCAGMVLTNAGPSLAAYGGRAAALGNNALCFAFPSGPQLLVIDMAVGAAACGKVRVAALDGQELADPWLIDHNGVRTTDPAALDAGGAMLPAGEHKGYALAVAIDAFTGALGGGVLSPQVRRQRLQPDRPQGVSQTLLAVNLASLGTQASMSSALGGFVDMLRSLQPSPLHDAVLAPGDPELQQAAIHEHDGVDIPLPLVEELNALAQALGVPSLNVAASRI